MNKLKLKPGELALCIVAIVVVLCAMVLWLGLSRSHDPVSCTTTHIGDSSYTSCK